MSGYLDDSVQLSNKACPRYYVRVDGGEDHRRCGCPRGRCWYDEQLVRRREGKAALTSEEWDRRLRTEGTGKP